jgi:drug/metabolite transporter (DMT)-like permease
MQSYRTGVMLVLAAGTIWSTMVLGVKLIGDQNPWAILIWRSLGMLPVLLLILAATGRLAGLFRFGPAVLLAAPALAFCFAAAIMAVQMTNAANAVFPLAVTPLFSALLARLLLREAIRPATWAAIGLAVLGIGVMVGEGGRTGDLAGTLVALAGAACFALFTVCLRWGAADTVPATFWGAVTAAILGVAVAPALGLSPLMPLPETPIALGLGAVVLGLGLYLFGLGSRSVPAAELSLLSMTEILLSPVWVWLLLGQATSPAMLAGGGIVVLALTFNTLTGLRSRVRTA